MESKVLDWDRNHFRHLFCAWILNTENIKMQTFHGHVPDQELLGTTSDWFRSVILADYVKRIYY